MLGAPAAARGAPAAAPEAPAAAPGWTRRTRDCPWIHCGRVHKRPLTVFAGHSRARRAIAGSPECFAGGAADLEQAPFFRNERNRSKMGLATGQRRGYFESRRGTEPQRARPLRCEAAPPVKEGPRARRSRFLKRLGTASLYVRGQFLTTPRPRARLGGRRTFPGTTGFDVVGSWGWWRVEVPGGLVKHPGKP